MTEQKCILTAGARLADSVGDISFLVDAQKKDEAEHPESVFIHRYRVVADKWESAGAGARVPPAWFVLAVQPIREHALDPPELVQRGGPDAYVAYVEHPTRAQLRRVDRCLRRVAGKRG
jgi:hypothetical protein